MRIVDYIKKSFINIIRNKKKIYYLIVMFFCSLIFLLVILVKTNFDNYINCSINKNLGFRTLGVSPKIDIEDLGKSELLNIEHVLDVYNSQYDSKVVETDFKNENLDGTVELLYGSVNSQPNIVLGRGFEKGDKNVAICPYVFYPDESVYQLKLKEDYFIYGEELLNKDFTIKYSEIMFDSDTNNFIEGEKFSETYKIIGLYDNKEIINLNNQCYIMDTDITSIINKSTPDNNQEYNYPYFYVIVDDVDNIDEVISEIKNRNYNDVYIKNWIDVDLVKMFEVSYIVLLSIIIFVVIVLNLLYVKKILLNDSVVIGVLRTIGYSKQKLSKMYFIEFLIIDLFAYLTSLIFIIILFYLIKNSILFDISYIGINLSIYPSVLIVTFIIIIIISAIIIFHNISKKCNSEIINLLGSDL